MLPSGQPGPTSVDFGRQNLLNRRRKAGLNAPAAAVNPTPFECFRGSFPPRPELHPGKGVLQSVTAEEGDIESSVCLGLAGAESFSRALLSLAWRVGVLLLALIGFGGGALADG